MQPSSSPSENGQQCPGKIDNSFVKRSSLVDRFLIYEGLFCYFNEALFEGRLPGIVLNFESYPNTVGSFVPDAWVGLPSGFTHEISVDPDDLERRPLRLIASTIVHEQVHLWQHLFGTPSRTAYHNREWAEKMEQLGLVPSDTGRPGGKRTGYRMSHYIKEGGPFERVFSEMPRTLRRLCERSKIRP